MSGPLLGLIAAAVGLAGFGLHVLSLHLNRFPTDARRPERLVSSRRSTPRTADSAELRRLVAVVSNAIVNDPSARVELNEVFAQLGAPGPLGADAMTGRRTRHRRSRDIERAIAELERRWGLAPEAESDRSDPPLS